MTVDTRVVVEESICVDMELATVGISVVIELICDDIWLDVESVDCSVVA